jgi:dsRNA-specific ribonuclease
MPKSPISELHKLRPGLKIDIEYSEIVGDGEKSFEAALYLDKEKEEVFVGKGMSRSSAKKSAFKKAVRELSPNKRIIFF